MAKKIAPPRFFPFGVEASDQEASDYMPVGPGDKGNATYDDRGMLGGYASNDGKPFEPPADQQHFDGYGATMDDIKRGYCKPALSEHPAYDKVNYSSRASQPGCPDEDVGNTVAVPSDYEFQSRNNRAKGFLVRRRLPTER